MPAKQRVLFLCVGNSCRSQMAEGLLRDMASDQFDVESAGTVAAGLSPNAVKVMAEIGVDLSGQRSKRVEKYAESSFDYVITLCNGSEDGTCPAFLGEAARRLQWPFEDPVGATGREEDVLRVFRRVRDQIGAHLQRFLNEKAKREWSIDVWVEEWELRAR